MISDEQRRNAILVLARLVEREPDRVDLFDTLLGGDPALLVPIALSVAIETGGPLIGVVEKMVREKRLDPEVERSMLGAIPFDSSLSRVALTLSERLVEVRAGAADNVQKAVDLITYSEWLHKNGQHREAHAAALDSKAMAYEELGRWVPSADPERPSSISLVARIVEAEARSALAQWQVESALRSLTDAVQFIERRLGIGIDEDASAYGGLVEVTDPRLASLLALRAGGLMRFGHFDAALESAERAERMWLAVIREPDLDHDHLEQVQGLRSDVVHIALPQTRAGLAHYLGMHAGGTLGEDKVFQALMNGEIEVSPRLVAPVRARFGLSETQLLVGQILLMQGNFSRSKGKFTEAVATLEKIGRTSALPEARFLLGLVAAVSGKWSAAEIELVAHALRLQPDRFRLLDSALPIPREEFGMPLTDRLIIVIGLARVAAFLTDDDELRAWVANIISLQAGLAKARPILQEFVARDLQRAATDSARDWLGGTLAELVAEPSDP